MSQHEPTDLLCRARRDELSTDEQRLLNASLERSLEVRLMNELLSQFESESNVRPGDDLLLARITARALGAPLKASRRKRPRLSMLLVAAAVLLVASLAGAWLAGVRFKSAPSPSVPANAPAAVKTSRLAHPRSLRSPRAAASATSPDEVAPPSSVSASPPNNVSSSPISTTAPEYFERADRPNRTGDIDRTHRGPKTSDLQSAGALFAEANLLRREGSSSEAALVYQRLLDRYPNSREAGPSRLALGKYFEAKQPDRALAQYRMLAEAGGALRAEALWGIAELANRLGERSLEERARSDLLREYPDSAYAEVARSRAAHGPP